MICLFKRRGTRDRPAVLKFFKKAIGSSGLPQKVNIDKSGSNTAALERINNLLFIYGLWHLLIDVRRIKYLNNMVEQDHRGIKNITKYTLGFKSFESAEATIAVSSQISRVNRFSIGSST